MTARWFGVGAKWAVGAASAFLALAAVTRDDLVVATLSSPFAPLGLEFGLTPLAAPFLALLALLCGAVGLWSLCRARTRSRPRMPRRCFPG